MNGFEFYAPTKIIFGLDTEKTVGEEIAAIGAKKVLIHYGGGSAEKSGLLDVVKQSLEGQNIEYELLGGVKPNPRLSLVYKGIELCRKTNVDFILAVGGGSVIDSSKAIAFGAAEKGDVWELYTGKRRAKACLPIGTVLTIAAAGSEMSMGSVITKEEGGLKRSYDDNMCRSRFSIMDPRLTLTLPAYQTACGCADILMHTMERYFTNGGNMEITDAVAEALMRTVITNATRLHACPDDLSARAEIMWSGSLSHNGLTACGNAGNDFTTHKLEHELGGLYDVAHGAGLTALWGSWARYCYKDCLPRFVRFAKNVMNVLGKTDDETALLGIAAAEKFFVGIGMPISLAELGITVTKADIEKMARQCADAVGGSTGSAKRLCEGDMIAVYKNAL